MNNKQLKSCPKCGETNKLDFFEDNCACSEQNWLMLGCGSCGIILRGVEISHDAEEDYLESIESAKAMLVESWNTRTAPEWTAEPPTEPGWYWIHTHNAYGESFTPRIVRIRSNSPIDRHPEEILTVHEFFRVCSGLSLETFVGEYKHCRPIRWLKIEEPETPTEK